MAVMVTIVRTTRLRWRWWLPLALAASLPLLWWALHDADPSAQPAAPPMAGASAAALASPSSNPFGGRWPDIEQNAMAVAGSRDAAPSALKSVRPPKFRADGQGRLVIDAQTRHDLELVFGLYQGPSVLQTLSGLAEGLPGQARQDLLNTYNQYVHYQTAVEQALAALPPEEPLTLSGALREFDVLREVRRRHFGEAVAEAMFGEEEQRTQALNDYMAQHTDPTLPLGERAALAQAAWWKAHERDAKKPDSP